MTPPAPVKDTVVVQCGDARCCFRYVPIVGGVVEITPPAGLPFRMTMNELGSVYTDLVRMQRRI